MSHSPNKILLLLKKDFLLEWRQKYSLYGVILYIVSTVFTIKMLQDSPDGEVWNSLFWIVILFASINAVAKSFLQESKQRNIYYYSVHDPKDIIISKLIYNVVLMLGMSLITLLLFVLLLGNPSFDFLKFMQLSLLGGVSMALLFTTLAAIAGKAGGNSALIAILGLPIVIPQIILLADLSKPLFMKMAVSGWEQFLGVLILLDVLIIALSIILFPFIWKE